MHRSFAVQYELNQTQIFVQTVPSGPRCWTNTKRVQQDKKMKIQNDKMSRQIRMALPSPQSFFVKTRV
jgi:hypothetical protein